MLDDIVQDISGCMIGWRSGREPGAGVVGQRSRRWISSTKTRAAQTIDQDLAPVVRRGGSHSRLSLTILAEIRAHRARSGWVQIGSPP